MSDIQLRKIDTLAPYERNSRTHTPKQIKAIVKSIEQFGFVGAVVIRDGVIAKGHATLQAVQQIYEAKGKVYPAPGKKAGAKALPAGTVPVIDCTGWTDAQFKTFVITDNRISEMASWDRLILSEELPLIESPDLTELLGDLDVSSILVGSFNSAGRYDLGQSYTFEPDGVSENSEAATESANITSNDGGDSFPVAFTLNREEYELWMSIKARKPSLSHKKIFLDGAMSFLDGLEAVHGGD